jgi:DNA polymerase III delta prime subunit
MIEEKIWVEKYRPAKIQDTILPNSIKDTFQDWVDAGDFPNLLLSSGPGTGKTTCAVALCKELDYDYILLNGSNEGRSIDVVRDTITKFASTVSLNGRPKCVIMDEADYMNPSSVQPALRNLIEEYSKNVRFIFTCNYLNKIIGPLHSRTTVVKFTVEKSDKPSLMGGLMKRLMMILKSEGVTLGDPKILAKLIERHYPDNRRIINELQRHSSGGDISVDVLDEIKSDNLDALIGSIKSKDFNAMRTWFGENIDSQPDLMVSNIVNYMIPLLDPSSVPETIVTASEYLHKLAFAADPEIHLAAFGVEVMVSSEWK